MKKLLFTTSALLFAGALSLNMAYSNEATLDANTKALQPQATKEVPVGVQKTNPFLEPAEVQKSRVVPAESKTLPNVQTQVVIPIRQDIVNPVVKTPENISKPVEPVTPEELQYKGKKPSMINEVEKASEQNQKIKKKVDTTRQIEKEAIENRMLEKQDPMKMIPTIR